MCVWGLPAVKESTCNTGDKRNAGSIPGWGRSPGGGNDNPLQYPCLENSMDRGALRIAVCGVVESRATERTRHFSWCVYVFEAAEEVQENLI